MSQAPNMPATDDGLSMETSSKWLTVFVILLFFSLAGTFLADRIFNPENFRITDIEIRGDFNHVNTEDISSVVNNRISGNYFSVDLEDLENRINTLSWVHSTSLRRQWPSTLVIDIVEVVPVAIWGESQWLNFTGDLVDKELPLEISFKDLPKLSGPESTVDLVWQSYRDWSGKFASNGLYLEGLMLDSSRLWHLELSLGSLARIKQPASPQEDETVDRPALSYVSMVVDSQFSSTRIDRFIRSLNQNLILEFPYMKSIDLRYPNGFTILWQDGQNPEQRIVESQPTEEIVSQYIEVNPVASN